MAQLLIETEIIKVDRTSLLESMHKNDGRVIVRNMVIQRADIPNKNRRIYSKNILDREMSRLMEGIKKTGSKGLIGELDHPDSNTVNLKNACLGVLDWRWKGNDLLGDVEVLNTPSGNILKEILLGGYVAGISSRGLGSVKQLYENDDPDLTEVQDDFELVTYDAVSDPSTHEAYFKEIREGRKIKEIKNSKYIQANKLITQIICEISGVCCLSK
jgi:hypothetical protein